jgi:hypothetical protein
VNFAEKKATLSVEGDKFNAAGAVDAVQKAGFGAEVASE